MCIIEFLKILNFCDPMISRDIFENPVIGMQGLLYPGIVIFHGMGYDLIATSVQDHQLMPQWPRLTRLSPTLKILSR